MVGMTASPVPPTSLMHRSYGYRFSATTSRSPPRTTHGHVWRRIASFRRGSVPPPPAQMSKQSISGKSHIVGRLHLVIISSSHRQLSAKQHRLSSGCRPRPFSHWRTVRRLKQKHPSIPHGKPINKELPSPSAHTNRKTMYSLYRLLTALKTNPLMDSMRQKHSSIRPLTHRTQRYAFATSHTSCSLTMN